MQRLIHFFVKINELEMVTSSLDRDIIGYLGQTQN